MQALQPEVVPAASAILTVPTAVRADFSYTSLIPYPPQTLATLTASLLRRRALQAQEVVNGTVDPLFDPGQQLDANLTTDHPTDLCFLHVGKSGGGSLIDGLAATPNISNMVVVHDALLEPVLLRERSPRQGLTVHRYDGPLVEGLPSFSACVNTGQVVTWVRDPVSRFLSTWHSAVCFEADCDDPRSALWETAIAMDLTGKSTTATSLDLNMLIDELARRDGGEMPGRHTFSFFRAIDDGISGLAAYLPDCSVNFLRRHPLRFVGRAEHMEKDWLSLFGQVNSTAAPVLAQDRVFDPSLPRRRLSRSSINWLRTFYRDDYVCMKNLGEADLVPKDYVQEINNRTTEYFYWTALSQKCYDVWRAAGDKSIIPDARCSIEPWPRPLDHGKGAWEVNSLRASHDFALESREPLNESFLPFNGGESWTAVVDQAELRQS
jgi:hypothetical protein